ncbi:hypothetical protein [Acidovorax sp. Leaf78]|uniref:hypothetical protein n=1 Tax=Acidovorax sp. Leaf78 TaxID=1736237 RepID=UPI0006FB1198|nr:hypothetical protein [Acidovorax sp. Leaf78]KQO23483.1 hypothetical protein ASF16_04790 [Acidovorax sp. Leaf78]
MNLKPKKVPRESAQSFEVPDWINRQHWDAWHSCLKRKKATAEQKQLAVDKLAAWRDEGVDYAKALESAAIAGWQGLFKPDVAGGARQRGAPNQNKHAAAHAALFEGVMNG